MVQIEPLHFLLPAILVSCHEFAVYDSCVFWPQYPCIILKVIKSHKELLFMWVIAIAVISINI